MLDWTQGDLAQASGVSDVTIRNFERGKTEPQPASMQVMRQTLQTAGVEFINDERAEGVVRLRT